MTREQQPTDQNTVRDEDDRLTDDSADGTDGNSELETAAGTGAPAESVQAEELPVPPWTAAPEHATDAAPAEASNDAAADPAADPAFDADAGEDTQPEQPARTRPGSAVAFLNRPVRPRTWGIAGLATVVAVGLFGAGLCIGARDPLLAPVRIAPAPLTAGPTAAERVYATASESVVTVHVPAGGTGSGFFYRPDRVVTNDHVVASSAAVIADLADGKRPKVSIVLADGRTRDARVLAVDPRIDLAILETPTGLGVRPLSFADTDNLAPGQPAFVVGAPFGLATSVSSGIISGLDRGSRFAEDPVQNRLIQTDAAVNPGNSGGPLLDETAGVVGIVTLRPDEADGRSTQGLAFALPADTVVAVIDQLERYGKVSHPQIGVTLRSPDADKPGQRGPVVDRVVPKSAAAVAGLRRGDQLLVVDGVETHDAPDVIDTLVGLRAGAIVKATVLRAGETFRVDLRLRERPENS